ncbi:thioredoxin family protein [Luteimicrobium subarcticum]|uniref:Thioredoxin n=1 Tax=Luteimicrobium subarcticum TaxID=620910 RepID=A0A2M8WW03_9MICO|nr:thioredoxin family protein [Luteimicrobium subarcticum]PJI95096.1 thioredoxin [Luteimicrobium subarcticum]
MVRVLLVVAIVALTLVAGAWWRSRQGRVRQSAKPDAGRTGRAGDTGHRDKGPRWADAGVDLAPRATFVQFSAEFCGPCRTTSRTLDAVRADTPGVGHVELDVDRYPVLVRQLSVLRAPTVVVLDAHGHEVARMTGAVQPRQAREALDLVPV